jgi:hypothetical protein
MLIRTSGGSQDLQSLCGYEAEVHESPKDQRRRLSSTGVDAGLDQERTSIKHRFDDSPEGFMAGMVEVVPLRELLVRVQDGLNSRAETRCGKGATVYDVEHRRPVMDSTVFALSWHILQEAARLADSIQLNSSLAEQQFGSNDLTAAYEDLARGSKGKVMMKPERRHFLASSALAGLDVLRRRSNPFGLQQSVSYSPEGEVYVRRS